MRGDCGSAFIVKTCQDVPIWYFPVSESLFLYMDVSGMVTSARCSSGPGTRTGFWRQKIEGNIGRDRRAQAALVENDWRVLVVWECALRGPQRRPVAAVLDEICRWFGMDESFGVIRG
jgi:hypothetical protein